MKKIILVLVAVLFVTAPVWAAQQICGENFENVAPGYIPVDNPTGSGEITSCGRPFSGQASPADGAFVATGGNPGQCAMGYVQSDYIDGDSYTMPSWDFDNTIGGSRQLYFKFDLRIDASLGTSNETREINNFKLCRMSDYIDAPHGDWVPTINFQPSSSSYSLYHWTTYESTEYYFSRATTKLPNHMMDNQWHTYEVFLDIGTAVVTDKYDDSADGIVRIWEDGILILEDTAACFREGPNDGTEINSVQFLRHAKSYGAPVFPMSGHLYFDNIEVWDGMPDEVPPPENNPPVANDDQTSVNEDSEADIDVLDNDSDLDEDTLNITGISTPSHGTAVEHQGGILYTPDADYNGEDQFGYTISDGNGGTDSAVVDVNVIAVNDPPSEPDIIFPLDLPEDILVAWNCSDPDGDYLTYDVVLDIANPPQEIIAEGLAQKSYTLTDLAYATTYYLQVVAHDGTTSTSSAIYSFTTESSPLEGYLEMALNRSSVSSRQDVKITARYTHVDGGGNFILAVDVMKDGVLVAEKIRRCNINDPEDFNNKSYIVRRTRINMGVSSGTYSFQVKAYTDIDGEAFAESNIVDLEVTP